MQGALSLLKRSTVIKAHLLFPPSDGFATHGFSVYSGFVSGMGAAGNIFDDDKVDWRTTAMSTT